MATKNSTSAEGRVGETVAANYLMSLGYKVVARNFRSKYGEVDIIALDGEVYAFVEVKMRADTEVQSHYGRPLRAVNAQKRQRLLMTAKEYIRENSLRGHPARIDVMEIYKSEHEDCVSFRINYIKHAVRDERRSEY